MQYGVWLKGEPGRRVGKDQGKTEDGSRSEFRSGKDEIAVEKFTQETSRHGRTKILSESWSEPLFRGKKGDETSAGD